MERRRSDRLGKRKRKRFQEEEVVDLTKGDDDDDDEYVFKLSEDDDDDDEGDVDDDMDIDEFSSSNEISKTSLEQSKKKNKKVCSNSLCCHTHHTQKIQISKVKLKIERAALTHIFPHYYLHV